MLPHVKEVSEKMLLVHEELEPSDAVDPEKSINIDGHILTLMAYSQKDYEKASLIINNHQS